VRKQDNPFTGPPRNGRSVTRYWDSVRRVYNAAGLPAEIDLSRCRRRWRIRAAWVSGSQPSLAQPVTYLRPPGPSSSWASGPQDCVGTTWRNHSPWRGRPPPRRRAKSWLTPVRPSPGLPSPVRESPDLPNHDQSNTTTSHPTRPARRDVGGADFDQYVGDAFFAFGSMVRSRALRR